MARAGEVSALMGPRFAFALPHLLDQRKIGNGGRRRRRVS